MVPAGLRVGLRRFIFPLAWLASGVLVISSIGIWTSAALEADWPSLLLTGVPIGIALGVWLAVRRCHDLVFKAGWQTLSLCWLVFAETVWLAAGYFQNLAWLFFTALALIFLTLLWLRRAVSFSAVGKQVIHTAILLIAAIPVIETAARIELSPLSNGRPISGAAQPGWRHPPAITAQNASRFYSYDEAHGDPGAFSLWWSCIASTFETAGLNGFYEPYPGHTPPHRLRPNGRGVVMDSVISINSRGFRGPELAEPKGNVYRIVCLGESTTFGITFRKEDQPWPLLLQQMIQERLRPARPVEVVNAGIPAWDLAGNLDRLGPEILPVRPDMLISYHGFNGFAMIDSSLPPVYGPPAPPYPNRPLRCLAELEYRHDIDQFIRENRPPDSAEARQLPPLQTRYADCYRSLVAFAQTNHIRLALANFSMAIDRHSPQKLLDFYNAYGSGILYVRANVNAVHSEIVRRLAAQSPGVIFVDSQPGLNCVPSKFIDVVHLTQEGRRQLAENIFAAIRPQLEIDLGKPTR